jgi:hypothetical protein
MVRDRLVSHKLKNLVKCFNFRRACLFSLVDSLSIESVEIMLD